MDSMFMYMMPGDSIKSNFAPSSQSLNITYQSIIIVKVAKTPQYLIYDCRHHILANFKVIVQHELERSTVHKFNDNTYCGEKKDKIRYNNQYQVQ